MDKIKQEQNDNFIAGRNAVIEALKSKLSVDVIYISSDDSIGSIGKIRAMAREQSIVVKKVTNEKLNSIMPGFSHQGVIATVAFCEYKTVDDILKISKDRGTKPFIIIADEIEDPHNLGAIIRTAEACGADGVIIPKRRSASVNATVYKTSAGAASSLLIAKVSNLVSTIQELKKENIWVFGADIEGQTWCEADFNCGVCLVIGSEGVGISRLIKKECDFLVSIPMYGQINSLNASVASGIIMYEIVKQRIF